MLRDNKQNPDQKTEEDLLQSASNVAALCPLRKQVNSGGYGDWKGASFGGKNRIDNPRQKL